MDLLFLYTSLGREKAGIFGAAEGGSGGGQKPEEAVEMSSENSVPGKSRSDDDYEGEQHSVGDAEEDDENNGNKLKKRKKYHRHTPEQIREMEAYVTMWLTL